jgi:hypothetical protein
MLSEVVMSGRSAGTDGSHVEPSSRTFDTEDTLANHSFVRIRAILDIKAKREMWYSLVDRNGNVIVTTATIRRPWNPFPDRGRLTAQRRRDSAVDPELPTNASTIISG